jgi:uncharacterized protein
MKGKITVTGANLLFFIFTALFFAFQVVLAVLSIIYGGNLINNNIYGILIVNEYVLILIPVLIFAFVKKLNFKEVFRFNNPGLMPSILITVLSLPAYCVALMFNSLAAYLIQLIGNILPQPIPSTTNLKELAVGILVVAVSPAICEEMLHRGIMLKAYENRGTVKAVVITALLFGIFHFDITNLIGPVFLGLLIGYYVVRTNSIFAGMLAHFLNNSIAEVIQYIWKNRPETGNLQISLNELGFVVLLGIGSLMLILSVTRLFNRVTKGKCRIRPSISSPGKDISSILSHWPVIVVLVMYFLILVLYLLSIAFTKLNLFP